MARKRRRRSLNGLNGPENTTLLLWVLPLGALVWYFFLRKKEEEGATVAVAATTPAIAAAAAAAWAAWAPADTTKLTELGKALNLTPKGLEIARRLKTLNTQCAKAVDPRACIWVTLAQLYMTDDLEAQKIATVELRARNLPLPTKETAKMNAATLRAYLEAAQSW
jgi:hypothetical protein